MESSVTSTGIEPESQIIEDDTYWVGSLQFSRDGRRLIAGDHDGSVIIWSIGGNGATKQAEFDAGLEPIYEVAFEPEGEVAAACGQQGVKVWWLRPTDDVAMEEKSATLHIGPICEVSLSENLEIHTIAFSPRSRQLLAAGSDMAVRLIRWETGIIEADAPAGERNSAISWHPDGTTFAVACSWQGGSRVQSYKLTDHRVEQLAAAIDLPYDGISGAAFSPDGALIAVPARELCMYEYPSCKLLYAFDYEGRRTAPQRPDSVLLNEHWTRAAFTDAGELICAPPQGEVILVFDPRAGRLLRKLKGHPGGTFDVAAQPSGRLMASSGYEGFVRLRKL